MSISAPKAIKLNNLFNLLAVLLMLWAELGDQIITIVPMGARHYVTVAVAVGMWLKSNKNLWVNPDNTPASQAYKQ